MAHDHNHVDVHEGRDETRLGIALCITAGYMLVEVVGGLVFNSLALLADAGHMLSDAMAQGLAFAAIRIGRRTPTDRLTYGFKRTEILAALWNGLALWAIVAVILYEAAHRLANPSAVTGTGMLAVAVMGLIVNAGLVGLLFRDRRHSLNVRGVFLHALSDTLGSVGAILAAVIILTTGLYIADPLVSVLISMLILYSSWGLIKESVHILMEGVPAGIDINDVEKVILTQDGVCCIHDLHVWSIESNRASLSAHVVLAGPEQDQDQIIRSINMALKDNFNIDHTTIQLETTHDLVCDVPDLHCRPGTVCNGNQLGSSRGPTEKC